MSPGDFDGSLASSELTEAGVVQNLKVFSDIAADMIKYALSLSIQH